MKKLPRFNPVWFSLCTALLMLYFYLCFAYNLQFYTEDERYIQFDMTNLVSLYQWGMTNYRVSSSLGCFIYYPLLLVMNVVSGMASYLSGGELELLIIPMMLSKLSHSILVFAGWLWLAFETGRILNKKWEITPWIGLLCLLFTALLPVNIFLAKTNNYDSIYNIFCLVAATYFYRYMLSNNKKELGIVFFLFALAMQEKFAAYPIFMVFLLFTPFFMETGKHSSRIKDFSIIISAIIVGSLLPTVLRLFAELLWAPDSTIVYKHLSQYKPFLTFPKALGTAKHFLGMDGSIFSTIVKYAFVLHILGFGLWTFCIQIIRQKIDFSKLKDKRNLWITLAGIVQAIFIIWAFASVWYTVPESGKYPFDTPPAGTYLPPHLTDSHPTFYYGANHFEYVFIRLIQTIGFFKPMVYSPMLILLLFGPVITFFSLRMKDDKSKSIALFSVVLFNMTMILVVLVNLAGVPFGGRYANIYVTLLGISSFLNLLFITLLFSRVKRINDNKVLTMIIITLSIIFMAELWPYGPSYQVFGNWFYPTSGCGGWGEPTSTLIQAARKDPFLKRALGRTYTTYTGLGIEKPFLTPLINLRLVRARSENNIGKRRDIQYLLAERTAIGQNPWLKNVRDVALTVEGAIVWEWTCRDLTAAWLIDLYKLGMLDFKNKIAVDKVERHYPGEWFF